jgi:ribonuclease P protein component
MVFDLTRAQGKRVSNRYLTLSFLPRKLEQPASVREESGSVAFLTPKRIGAANIRNRLRRRMREIYRRQLALPEEESFLIWIARPPAVELPFEELQKCMAALRQRVAEKKA